MAQFAELLTKISKEPCIHLKEKKEKKNAPLALNSFLTISGEESQGRVHNSCFIFTDCGGNLPSKSENTSISFKYSQREGKSDSTGIHLDFRFLS